MKIFWTIVIIIILVLGYKLLTKDSTPADTTNNEAAAVMSETDAMAGDQTTDAMTGTEEGAAMDDAGTPAN